MSQIGSNRAHCPCVVLSVFPPAAGCGLILYFNNHNKYGYNPNTELGPVFNHCQCNCERLNIPVTDNKPCKQNFTTTCRSYMQNKLFNGTSPKTKNSN